eukprot:gene30702-35727_t
MALNNVQGGGALESKSSPSVEAWGMGPHLTLPARSSPDPAEIRALSPSTLPKQQNPSQWAAPASPKTHTGRASFQERSTYAGATTSRSSAQLGLKTSSSSQIPDNSVDFLYDDDALSAIHERAANAGSGVGHGDRPSSMSQIRKSLDLKLTGSRLAN